MYFSYPQGCLNRNFISKVFQRCIHDEREANRKFQPAVGHILSRNHQEMGSGGDEMGSKSTGSKSLCGTREWLAHMLLLIVRSNF
jgi:hypothetical protein